MKKATKISLIVIASVVSLLAITIVILALVPSNFQNVTLNDYAYLTVYNGTTKSDTDYFRSSDSEYNKIIDLYNHSFSERVLVCMFTGAYKADRGVEETKISNVISSENSTYIVLHTAGEDHQNTLVVDGKTYRNSSGNTISFTTVILELNSSSSLETATLYIVDDSASNEGTSTFVSNYRVNLIAKFADLYNYVQSL